MPKLAWELDLKGGETVAQKFRDLNKEVATLQGNMKRGIGINDLIKASGGNFSQSFLKANPDLQAMLSKSKSEPSGSGLDFSKFVPKRLQTLLGAEGGGLAAGIITTLGAIGAFKAALWALSPVIDAVKYGLKQIMDAIREGSKLYTDSAKLGMNPRRLAGLQFASSNLGISSQEAQLMLLASEFPRGTNNGNSLFARASTSIRGGAVYAGGAAFGSNGRINMLGEQQKLNNLMKEFNREMDDSAEASARIGSNAKLLYYAQYDLNRLTLEWKAAWSDISAAFAPILMGLATMATYALKIYMAFDSGAQAMRTFAAIFKNAAGPSDFKRNFPSFVSQSLNPNQFQRMGFVMNGGFIGNNDYAKRIAQGVEKLVSIVQSNKETGSPYFAHANGENMMP